MARPAIVVLLLLLAACDQEGPASTSSPSTTVTPEPSPEEATTEPEAEPEPEGDEASYVVFPEIGEVEVSSACQTEGPDGPIYRAELENGGSLQLRKLPDGILHASALPSPEADPVGTNVPSDTSFTEDGGWINGTSVMWLAETENNITVEYHVRWDRSIVECETS